MEYYTILTDAGRALETAALAGKVSYTLATCALGDGGKMPDPTRTALQNEVWRGPINSIAPDANNPTWLVIETRVPPEDGGFTIREFGIYTDEGVLFAIGNYPELYKPTLAEGTGIDLVVSPICQVSNATSVTLLTDTSIMMATKKYVDERTENIQRRNIGEVFHYQGRSAPFGAVVADGGLVRREMYPDLWTFAQAQNLVVAETEWQAQAGTQGAVGVYSAGDGVSTFRLPLMTDFFRGAIDPAKIGTWQGDAIREISGAISGNVMDPTGGASGGFVFDQSAIGPVTAGTGNYNRTVSFKASRVVPTALENRPKTLFLLPCIQAYNTVIPDAQADMHGYLAGLNGKLDKVTYNACPIFHGGLITGTVTLPANSIFTRIPLTAMYDTHSGASGGDYLIPVSGLYLFYAGCSALTGRGYRILVRKNGTNVADHSTGVYTFDIAAGNAVTGIHPMTAGDVISLHLSSMDTVARVLQAGGTYLGLSLIRGV